MSFQQRYSSGRLPGQGAAGDSSSFFSAQARTASTRRGEPNASAAAATDTNLHGTASFDDVMRGLRELEQKLTYVERREQEGWRVASQQIAAITESSRGASTTVANLELKLSKDTQFIEETLASDVAKEATARQEWEGRMRRLIADEAAATRSALTSSDRDREGVVERRLNDLTQEVAALCESFDTRLTEVSGSLTTTLDVTQRQASAVEDMLQRHTAEREKAEMALLAVVEDTCVQLHQSIVQEREARAASQRRLEDMVEELRTRNWAQA